MPEESMDGGVPLYRLLVPVKETGPFLRDFEYLLKNHAWSKYMMEIHLLHVQLAVHQDIAPRPTGSCGRQVSRTMQELGARVDATGVPCVFYIGTGDDPAPVIARYAREQRCDHIFMGAGSRGEIAGLLLRRVTRRVIDLSEVPVLLMAR